MSRVVTDLSHSPYWDDYNVNKQFYRILFVPKRAVQVREMNQLQTMIQEQISRFGDHIFKDGSIVNGCNLTYLNHYDYVRCGVFVNDNANTNFTTDALKDMLIVSDTTGLRATIEIANPGYMGTYPDTNVMYINYLNKGRDVGDNEVAQFIKGETLSLYDKTQDKFDTLNPGLLYNKIPAFPANGLQTAVGEGYAVRVGDGIVYQKGYFVNVLPHTVIVRKYDTNTDGMLVGFQTNERIISYLQDPSLIDPADTSNRNGIGANRLKLSPELIAKNRADIVPTDNFFPIIEFGQEKVPVKQNTDPAYAKLGESMAKEQMETHGDFYINPFIVGSKLTANTQNFAYRIDPGIAYVKGNRVELIGAIDIETPRATDVGNRNNNITTLNYGNYVLIDEMVGTFGAKTLVTIDIYDAPQDAVSTNSGSTSPVTGTKVGTARARAVVWENGVKGTSTGTFRLYITDIKMNSGKSFTSDAKSFYVTSGNNSVSSAAKADIILVDGKAIIRDSSIPGLIFDLGVNGAKRLRDSQGANDTEFTFRDSVSATLQSNGSVTFTLNTPYAGGIERLFSSTGTVSAANKQRIDISTTANMVTAGNTSIVAGTVLNLANATVTVASNTQFIVNLGYSISSGAPQSLIATYPVIRGEANEIKKEVNRNTYVKIDCSNNAATTTGPFNLGIVDVFGIAGVYVGPTYSESNPERSGWFTLDSGQTNGSYEQARLILKPEFQGKLTSGSKVLVKLNHFIANTATGIGFFSVDSYPTRAPGVAANTSNISYEDIPEIGGFNLRNCVDFRPQRTNTANVSTTIGGATINPPISSSYAINPSGSYIGEPDSNLRVDLEYYLARRDLIQVNKDGIFNVKSSVTADKPIPPMVDPDAMPIANAFVPPYPGVTADDSAQYLATKPRIKTTLAGNRGYTMRDINALDKRLTVVEYYQALSMLEQQAKDYTVKDENGLDRFKNGIFADPLKNHLLGDVSNFEYNVAIDELRQVARPKIKKNSVDLDIGANTNINSSGRVASLAYTPELFISQPFASKFRNVTESVWNWTGSLSLYPEYDHFQDEKSMPAVNVEIDLSSPWEQFANSPYGQSFGDWRITSSTSSTGTSSSTSGRTSTGTSTTTTTTTTTTNILQQTVETLNVETSQTKNDLGSYVTDITLNPYMRSRQVAFIATGLRPNTKVYAFFDRVAVSQHCAPGTIDPTVYNQATGEIHITTGKEDQIILRNGDFGTQLVTDAGGNLFGIFRVPDQTFRVGDRRLEIVDVDDLVTGQDAILTAAKAIYTASSITTTTRNVSITTTDPTLSVSSSVNTKVDRATTVSQRVTTTPPITRDRDSGGDPLGQSVGIKTPADVPGGYLESIGVFFRTKDTTLGITCYMVEISAGVPDPSRVVGTSYLKPSAITTSIDSSAETIFHFTDIPYLENEKSYAFFLMPDGNSPNYTIWMSEVGGTDMLTGNKIFSNPYIGVAFRSANSESWDVLQTEDIKFNLYRCKFNTGLGTVVFNDQEDEYLTVDGFAYTNTGISIQVGDVVYTQNSSGGVITGNSAPTGFVQDVDWVNDKLVLDSSTGGFTANTIINIYRPSEPNNPASISANNLIATATIESIDNLEYSIVVPRIATSTPTGTSVSFAFKGIDQTGIEDANWTIVQPETELEMVDKVRVIRSKSNRGAVTKSSFLRLELKTTSDFISPTIDLRRRSLFAIDNIVNNDITNEHTRHGNAVTKYLSRVITLAEGQDAEDVKVLISGYRPVDTEIHAYMKVLCADDPDAFLDKYWTKLEMTEGASVRSSSIDTSDFREFVFSFPTTEAMQGTAWKNMSNDGIVQYRNSGGAVFIGYKQFALKFVFTSSEKQRVPRLDDIRGICLQI